MAVRAYIGLGSNLQDPVAQIAAALDALDRVPRSRGLEHSSLYRSPPMGPADQPDYVNAVAALETRLAPMALLQSLQAIEQAQGRVRTGVHWGPRTLDLDLLLYGDAVIDEPGVLVVPHPGIAVRAFVLLPLAEIAPALTIPGVGLVATLVEQLPDSGVVRL